MAGELERNTRKRAEHCVSDFEKYAQMKLDSNAWGYYSSGANMEQTLRDNKEAFQRYRLRPRMLRDVSAVDTRTSLLGHEVAFPVCVGATAMQRMAHIDGELATARAAAKMNTCMMLSSWSNTSIEDVAEASGSGLRWFQLHVYRDKEPTKSLLLRAQRAGYKAVVITIDTPIFGRRVTDAVFNLPPQLSLPNFSSTSSQRSPAPDNPTLTWEDVDWIRELTPLPVIVKGVLTAEDAREALRHNVQGIIVSNHGGRQLDGVLASIDALSEVASAVENRVEVFMDGGVRQGTDVLKALALGARAVFIGRPVLWGLAYNGEEGVVSALEMLREEFRNAMMLSGCQNVRDINPDLVVHESQLFCARL